MLGNYPQDCQNCLSSSALSTFLATNSVANQAVQNAIQTGYWPSGNPTSVGWTISDPTYGTVTLVTDANDQLYALVPQGGTPQMNAAVSNLATVTNAPPYESPTSSGGGTSPTCPGWSNISGATDFFACLGESSGEVLLIGGGILLLWLMK